MPVRPHRLKELKATELLRSISIGPIIDRLGGADKSNVVHVWLVLTMNASSHDVTC